MDFAKNAKIDGKVLDVITPEIYGANKILYQNVQTGVEIENPADGEMYILPVRNQTDDKPGIYDAGAIYFTKFPEGDEKTEYSPDSADVIDYNDISNVRDFISKRKQLRDIESEILTDIDNVFLPPYNQNDAPEMRALKEAFREKRCDINKYAPRYGDNYLNDKRILKGSSVTLNKAIHIAECMDMEIEIIIRDKNSEVPNPIGKEIRAILTGGSTNDE